MSHIVGDALVVVRISILVSRKYSCESEIYSANIVQNTTQNTVEMCHTLLGTQSVKLRPFPPLGFISIAPGRALEVKIYNVDIFFEV